MAKVARNIITTTRRFAPTVFITVTLITSQWGGTGNPARQAITSVQAMATMFATTAPVPLESLPQATIGDGGFKVIPPGNSANFQGQPIRHGLQASSVSVSGPYAFFRLDGHYSKLSGTIYEDDSNGGSAGTGFFIYNDDGHSPQCEGYGGGNCATSGTALFKYTLTSPISSTTFSVNVSGVHLLGIGFDSNDKLYDIVAALTPAAPRPIPAHAYVQAISPLTGAVATNGRVFFRWHPFRNSSGYLLRVWLARPIGDGRIPRGTPLTFSATIYGASSYSWQDRGFIPGVYDYDLLPLTASGSHLVDWSPANEFRIIG